MFTRPPTITDERVREKLARWGVDGDVEYRAVGFGSHHWAVTGKQARWFLTVDDREKRHRNDLAAALATAEHLLADGLAFVVAPVRTRAGELLVDIDERYVAALYPHVDGVSFEHGEYADDDERRDVLALVIALHGAAIPSVTRHEDFAVDERAQLVDDLPWGSGPYASRARELLAERADHVARLLRRYDSLAAAALEKTERFVVTHGEPHCANTMLTASGRVLIDWDTVLVAPPERDLWMVLPSAASRLAGEYEAETGTVVEPDVLELYKLQWDLVEIAGYTAFFRADHEDTRDAQESWRNLLHFIS